MKRALLTSIIRQIVLSYFRKIVDGRKRLRDEILLMFLDKTNACQTMWKTTNFDVSPKEEILLLRYCMLFSMHSRSLVGRYMTVGSPATHHGRTRNEVTSTRKFLVFDRSYKCYNNIKQYPINVDWHMLSILNVTDAESLHKYDSYHLEKAIFLTNTLRTVITKGIGRISCEQVATIENLQ